MKLWHFIRCGIRKWFDKYLLVSISLQIQGFENRKVIKAVTVLDGSYVKNNDGIYDTVTDRCLEGIKCRFETNSKTTCCVGFSIDLFQKIVFDLQFDVDMFIVSDGNYGAFKNGSWNGLIGEIKKGKADMAVSALTVMNERLQYVAFTAAYMEDYLGILVKPQEEKLSAINWKFIEPLAGELQLTLWFVIIIMMMLVYVFENNEFLATAIDGMKHFVKYYGALESMTYVAGVTLQRDMGGKNPSHFGAQFIAIIFAFGMVIFTTTYTAVLAAQSLQKVEVNPLKGSDDHRVSNLAIAYAQFVVAWVKCYLKRQCSYLTFQASTPQNGQTHSTISRLLPKNCLSVFDHFLELALNGLNF